MSQFDAFTHENRKALEDTRNSLVLGVLATGLKEYPYVAKDQEAITMNNKETAIFMFVQPISPEPDIINQLDSTLSSPLYFGRPKMDFGNHLPPGFKYVHTYEKQKEQLYNKFKDRVIVMRPRINYLEDGRVYKNLEIVACTDEWKEGIMYDAVPVITKMDSATFDKALLNGDVITLDDYSYTHLGPEYVICGEFLYRMKYRWTMVGPKQFKANNTSSLEKAEKSIANWDNYHVFGKETLMFLEEKFIKDIPISAWKSVREAVTSDNSKEVPSLDVEKTIEKPKPGSNAAMPVVQKADKPAANEEHHFLQHLMYLTREHGLYYSMETLVNFHVSVKTNPVTILSGMSGTGKSQLVLIYADALGLYRSSKSTDVDYESRLLVIPISPAYTEPEDLTGYLNAASGLFVPSETGLVDFLVRAEKDQENIYLVLFDEMNLSQVEHWFAPFLSRLELSDELRKLQLYSKNQICHNSSNYPATIRLHDNVLFVGTANMDETTRSFSDRLLDRVNIVTPEKMKFTKFYEEKKNRQEQEDYGFDASDRFREMSVFRSWRFYRDVWAEFSQEEMEFFENLHAMINTADPQKGVSFRSLKKIAEFVLSIPKEESGELYLDRRTVIDLQVKQRILTKVRGSSEQFRELIGVSADATEDAVVDSKLYAHFTSDVAKQISDFKLTLEEIRRKARELYMYDYAS